MLSRPGTSSPSASAFHREPLTPVSFLRRSATVYRDRTAVIDGERSFTYRELDARARGLASALAGLGVEPGDRVAVLGSNSQLLLTAHYGVPFAGAVLVAMNTRLSPDELGYIAEHSGAAVLLCDAELEELARSVARAAGTGLRVVSEDALEPELAAGSELAPHPVEDELSLLALNYTSGTTGRPKGVMYHHRGAYLQALAMAFHNRLGPDSVYLWVVPMFHCNGWCLTWGATAAGATHVCRRTVDPGELWSAVRRHGVTHFAAAPTVLTALANHPDAESPDGRTMRVVTGGAPPSPTLLAQLAGLGIEVTHAYGLTETFGPVMLCDWHPEWDELEPGERARIKARQGVNNVIAEGPRIVDDEGVDVPSDGATMGELVLRGNDLMLGYYRDPEATEAALRDGWFRTGDLGVMHPEGYVELRDRRKDVIISGGENITSVEVEQAIGAHPAVLEAAVVAAPDERWGERPAAFVTVKPGASLDPESVIAHVRERLASFKAPRDVYVVDELPKTSTGKVQKYALRERLWEGRDRRIGG
jgi:fatty-acyl-CoA synthase